MHLGQHVPPLKTRSAATAARCRRSTGTEVVLLDEPRSETGLSRREVHGFPEQYPGLRATGGRSVQARSFHTMPPTLFDNPAFGVRRNPRDEARAGSERPLQSSQQRGAYSFPGPATPLCAETVPTLP